VDPIFLITARCLELAEMTDQEKLTEAHAQLQFAQLVTEISDKERQRDRAARQFDIANQTHRRKLLLADRWSEISLGSDHGSPPKRGGREQGRLKKPKILRRPRSSTRQIVAIGHRQPTKNRSLTSSRTGIVHGDAGHEPTSAGSRWDPDPGRGLPHCHYNATTCDLSYLSSLITKARRFRNLTSNTKECR
jgi:hypothetical protein